MPSTHLPTRALGKEHIDLIRSKSAGPHMVQVDHHIRIQGDRYSFDLIVCSVSEKSIVLQLSSARGTSQLKSSSSEHFGFVSMFSGRSQRRKWFMNLPDPCKSR